MPTTEIVDKASSASPIEPRSARAMMLYSGAFLWLCTWFGVLAAGIIAPELAPAHVLYWEIGFSLISAASVASQLTWMKRLDGVRLFQVTYGWCFVAAAMNLSLMLSNPLSIGALYIALLAPAVFAAQFFRKRIVILQVLLLSSCALLPVLLNYGQAQQLHALSRVAAFIPIMWTVAFTVFALRKDREAAIRESNVYASTDPLTGLANLRVIRQRAEQLLAPRDARSARSTALLMIDLDDFKSANTLHGHIGGDHVLRTIAGALQRAASATHTVARIGGDEFAVLIENADSRDLKDLAIRYRKAVLSVGHDPALEGLTIDASVGWAITDQAGGTLEDLMTEADRSMYAEKAEHLRDATTSRDSRPASVLPLEFLAPRSDTPVARPPVAATRGGRLNHLRWSRRPKHARFAALTWAIGVTIAFFSLAMPDADHSHLQAALLGLAAGYIVSALAYVTAPEIGSWRHLSNDIFTLCGISLLVYLTGGANSPNWPLVFLFIIYEAWFLDARQIWFRLIGPVVVILLPLTYGFSQIDMSTGAALYSGVLVTIGTTVAMSYNQFYLAIAREATRRLATIDPLTGIANRREFERRMQDELDGLSYTATDALAIVMIDLDNFKIVNTEHGHKAGDELLAKIAAALESRARANDCVARVGGDEFAVVLPGVSAAVAQKLARRFLEAVAAETAQSPLPACRAVTASAGFALYGMHGRTLDELVNAADVALMSVKTSGKGIERVSSFVVAL